VNKITVVVPSSKSRRLLRLIKVQGIKRYVNLRDGDFHKFELIITELRTQELLTLLKSELDIRPSKPLSDGYITVHSTNLVAPVVAEKGKVLELDELILKDAKRFVKLDKNFLLFTVASAMIACLGFQLDNLVVLIGSMLISPLMAPIMSVSYGMARANKVLVWKGLKNELVGLSLILFTSLLMGLLPNSSLVLENSLAVTNLFLVLLLAVVIGVVAANSFISGKFEALTGVAVGISLLPPVTNFVLLVMAGGFINAVNSLFSFVFNVLGMHLSALVTFLVVLRLKKKNGKRV